MMWVDGKGVSDVSTTSLEVTCHMHVDCTVM